MIIRVDNVVEDDDDFSMGHGNIDFTPLRDRRHRGKESGSQSRREPAARWSHSRLPPRCPPPVQCSDHILSVLKMRTYLDKVDVVLLGLTVNVLELGEQHLVVGGRLVEEHHRQVVVPLDQAVQHGNLVDMKCWNQKLRFFEQIYRDTLDLLLLQFVKHPFDHLVVVS